MSAMSLKIATKRVAAVEDLVADLQAADAEYADEVGAMLAETAALLSPARQAVSLMAGGIRVDTATGQMVAAHEAGRLLTRILTQFETVREHAAAVRRSSHAVEGMDALAAAEAEVRGLQRGHAARWLLPDRATVESARTAVAEGRYRVH